MHERDWECEQVEECDHDTAAGYLGVIFLIFVLLLLLFHRWGELQFLIISTMFETYGMTNWLQI